MIKKIAACFGLSAMMVLPATAADPTIDLPLTFAGDNFAVQGQYGIGIDIDAAVGIELGDPAFDSPLPPFGPGPVGGSIAFFTTPLFDVLIRDVRPRADSITWRLTVELEDAANDTVTLTWTQAMFEAAGAVGLAGYTITEIRNSTTGAILADMSLTNEYVFQGSSPIIVHVVLAKVNIAPVGTNDEAVTFKNQLVNIAVLDNDIDADPNPNLTVVQPVSNPANGTATINGVTIDYTPDDNVTGEDTFTYTVSDGVDTDTATVTVQVFAGDVRVIRSHAVLAKAGTDADAGLTVTLQILISEAVETAENLTKLEIRETFPVNDGFEGFYSIPAGAGPNDLEITAVDAGDLPDSAATLNEGDNPDQSTMVFTYNFNDELPASPIEFSYKIKGNEPADNLDELLKKIEGDVIFNIGAGDVTEDVVGGNGTPNQVGEATGHAFTSFTPVVALHHSADRAKDFVISFPDLLRVIDLFKAGGYHVDELESDGFDLGADATPVSGHHSADRGKVWVISFPDLLRVIDLFKAGGYHVDDTQSDGYGLGLQQ